MSQLAKALIAAAGNAAGSFYDYEIENSLRFNTGNTDYLTFTPSTNGNNTTFTLRFMVKLCNLNKQRWLFLTSNSYASSYTGVRFNATNTLEYFNVVGGSVPAQMITSSVFRDVSSWYDIVISVSSTNVDIYVNGVEQPYGNVNQPNGESTGVNRAGSLMSTSFVSGISAGTLDGYVAEMVLVDGQALTPTSFGEFKNGIWVPKDCSGLSFGTNGAYLKFENSGALGTDSSGNSNNWTVNGLTSSDQVPDTPTNNYCTMNPLAMAELAKSNKTVEGVLSNGNLEVNLGTSDSRASMSTFLVPTTGKWAFKVTRNGAGNIQIGAGVLPRNGNVDVESEAVFYNTIGNIQVNGTKTQDPITTVSNGQYIEMFIDRDASEISFKKQGTTALGTAEDISSYDGEPLLIYVRENSVTQSGANFDFGQLGYTPTEADYLTLCTANLPEPTIGPNSATTSDENFNTVLYTGTGSARTVTGVGFQPDWLWIKKRSAAENHALYDVLRGPTKRLESNNTSAEDTEGNGVSSFDSDGFSIQGASDRSNTSGATYVAWNWKGNGSGVSNTDGSITSTVSANQDAGISIVTFTAPASGGFTVGHGLGATPAFVTVKIRDTAGYHWYTWHQSFASTTTSYNILDDPFAVSTGVYSMWPSGVSSTTASFNVNYSTLPNTDNLAYIFSEVEGFSSFGGYTGNGSTDGPFIYTGFKPAMLIVKRADSVTGGEWKIIDTKRMPYNWTCNALFIDSSSAENTAELESTYGTDILSNGVKIRASHSAFNTSGGTYIYMAFAENPFKYANAR
jgi:hypothetical protein